MLTAFKKYRDQQARAAGRGNADPAPAERKRTLVEILVGNIGVWSSKIGDLEFPKFTPVERASPSTP